MTIKLFKILGAYHFYIGKVLIRVCDTKAQAKRVIKRIQAEGFKVVTN